MDDQEKIDFHSRIFRGYVSEVSKYNDAPAFTIHLKSIRKTYEDEIEQTPISQKDFKISVICRTQYKEKDGSTKTDQTLTGSLLPSIHVGNLIEFKGFAYRTDYKKDGSISNPYRVIIEPKNLKQTHKIEMDRHYIRIMPPSKESLTRHQKPIKEKKQEIRNEKIKDIPRQVFSQVKNVGRVINERRVEMIFLMLLTFIEIVIMKKC